MDVLLVPALVRGDAALDSAARRGNHPVDHCDRRRFKLDAHLEGAGLELSDPVEGRHRVTGGKGVARAGVEPAQLHGETLRRFGSRGLRL